MKRLICTVGLPRSGKSTWARETGDPIVNPDAIRLAIHGQPFIGETEPFVWAVAKAMVSALFLAGHDTVILDATNTTRKRRDEWKSKRWVREWRVFGGPEQRELCAERAKTGASDLEHLHGILGAIERMADQWEPVEEDEWDAQEQPA